MSQSDDDSAARGNQQNQNLLVDAATLQALTAAITSAFTTVNQGNTTTTSHSSSIDPYNSTTLDVSQKSGAYMWSVMTKTVDGWKLLSVSVSTADKLMDLFKDRQTQFGLDPITNVPTDGDGLPATVPRPLAGKDYWNANLLQYKNLLIDIHAIDLDQVRAYSSWIMGGEAQKHEINSDMKIVAIDPNKAGNQGLVNRHKLYLRRLSGIFHFLIKNHITRTSYNSFYPEKDKFLYTDEVSGRKIVCGLIFLKMVMLVLKPQLVINHREKEKELEQLSLATCNQNVRTLLTSMQEKRNEIDTLRKDGVKFDEQRFLTLIFERLLKASCDEFTEEVRRSKNQWVKNPSKVDTDELIGDFINLYTNFKTTKDWDKVNEKDQKLIALTTNVKELKEENRKLKQQKTANPSNKSDPGLAKWRFEKKGTTITMDGAKYTWCPHHGRKKDGVQTGMHMPYGHDHDEWLAKKKSSSDSWKERQKEKREAGKRKSGDDSSDEPPKKKGGDDKAGKKLVLAKKMRSALTTKVQLGDEEADDFINGVLADYDSDSSSATDSSKE